jgi:hypothetical protein
VYALALQVDGKILIGGDFTQVNNTNRNRIAQIQQFLKQQIQQFLKQQGSAQRSIIPRRSIAAWISPGMEEAMTSRSSVRPFTVSQAWTSRTTPGIKNPTLPGSPSP